jgi:hypothetical protein
MNNNVVSVSKSLLGYIRKNDSSLGRNFSIAGVEFDTDPDESNKNLHSSIVAMLNTYVNNILSTKVNYSDGNILLI